MKRPVHLHDLTAGELRRVERLIKHQLADWSRLEDNYPDARDEIVADSNALGLVLVVVIDEARRLEQDEADRQYLTATANDG